MRGTLIALLLPAFLPCAALAQEEATVVRGRVVDADGAPVPDVPIGTGWRFDGDTATAQWRSGARTYGEAVRTGRDGRFTGPLYFSGRPVALVALDLATGRGGTVVLDAENVGEEQTITLRPLVRLRGSIAIGDPNLEATTVYAYVFDPRAPIAFASCITKERFSFRLPPGPHRLLLTAKDLERMETPVSLAPGGDVDLGTIDLSPTDLARHYGKEPPPWTVTAARGADPGVRLSDYKGKWVLIEFWAYW